MPDIINTLTITLKHDRTLSKEELKAISDNIERHVHGQCVAGTGGFASVQEVTISGDYQVGGKVELMALPSTTRKAA